MGQFSVEVEVAGLNVKAWKHVKGVLVDTGAETSWLPEKELRALGIKPFGKTRCALADGHTVLREKGYAFIRSGRFITVDEVIFAKSTDHLLLGAHTLEGFHAVVDPDRKRLIAYTPDWAHGQPHLK